MQAERDFLVKFIFPQLRKLCESRGVTWGQVDLRWGVTDEQAAEGKVLPICLEEIKRCRPYFIGLLGERYGWIPVDIPKEVFESEPWLKEHLHDRKSVTELEILHGVLNNPTMAGHAFFYLRAPAYLQNLPLEAKREDFTTEDAASAEKLRNLKDNIRRSGFPVRENYDAPTALGELVLADLSKVINDNWPEGSQPDPLDREAMDHKAYAQSRERVYIGRKDYFDRLDTHAAANDTQSLVVLGESGSGKSALLANWVARYRQAHPDALVLQHYIGATPYSADWAAMLRRLMGEFKRRLGLQHDIPDQPDALRSAFPNWLYMAAAKGRVVLVLDALNQLEDRDGAPDLVWLPSVLPENVRLFVSTLPGRPLDDIKKRNWQTLKVELLSAYERRKLIAEYLAQHAKSLNAARVDRIATAPPSANPLYLRVLLDELRLVRTHEELEDRIGDYLKAESPDALYEKVIARWEQDYETDPDLVGDTLSLLWAARRGLTETELLQALGKGGKPLARAKWSPLFFAMSEALISRGGLLTFAHNFLRAAVENVYLPTEQNQQQAHLRLANYFNAQNDFNSRKIIELPWQWQQANAWEDLWQCLGNPSYLHAAWGADELDVCRFWKMLENATFYRLIDAYADLIDSPLNNVGASIAAGQLFLQTGCYKQAASIRHKMTLAMRLIHALHPETKDEANYVLSGALHEEAQALHSTGHFEAALDRLFEAETISRATQDWNTVLHVLKEKCDILLRTGKSDHALPFVEEGIHIAREHQKPWFFAAFLEQQAHAMRLQGRLSEAHAVLRRVEDIARTHSDLRTLAQVLGKRALLFARQGRYREAWTCHEEEVVISRDLNEKHGVASALFGQVNILRHLREQSRAIDLINQLEKSCHLAGDRNLLAKCYGTRAAIFQEQEKYAEALEWHLKEEKMFREMKDWEGLAIALTNQAILYGGRLGQSDKARQVATEALNYARQGTLFTLARKIQSILTTLHTCEQS